MSTHVPDSPAVCIHSVCIEKAHQRKGIGLALLKEYIYCLESRNTYGAKYHRVLLITHEDLRSFYESAGLEWVGLSNVIQHLVVTSMVDMLQYITRKYSLEVGGGSDTISMYSVSGFI